MISFGSVHTSNDWIGFFGSYFGALVSGLVAFGAAYIQIKGMRREEERKEVQNFLKAYHVLSSEIHDALGYLINASGVKDMAIGTLEENMWQHLDSKSDAVYFKGKSEAKREQLAIEDSEKCFNNIVTITQEFKQIVNRTKNIDDDYIPFDFYKNYLDLINIFDNVNNFGEKFIDNYVPISELKAYGGQGGEKRETMKYRMISDIPGVVSEYPTFSTNLLELREQLEKKRQEQEEKLNDINGKLS